MKKTAIVILLFTGIIFLSQCRKPDFFPEDEYDERLSGGSNTVFDITSGAFGNAFPTLSGSQMDLHDKGDAAFEQTFVTAPAPVNSGLGPAFNNVSCKSCHHNDGKGEPTAGNINSSL